MAQRAGYNGFGGIGFRTPRGQAVPVGHRELAPVLFAPGRGQLHHLSPTSRALYAAMTS